MNIMRAPILDYLETAMPEASWDASRARIIGEVVLDGYAAGCFIEIVLYDDHLLLKDSKKSGRTLYYYQSDLLDILLNEAKVRYDRRMLVAKRSKQVIDIHVTLNRPELEYLIHHYGIEEDGGGNPDYDPILNTLISEKVKHLKKCNQKSSTT